MLRALKEIIGENTASLVKANWGHNWILFERFHLKELICKKNENK